MGHLVEVTAGFVRLIVQGKPIVDIESNPLAASLQNNQSTLGYIYHGELSEYLLRRGVDVRRQLITFKFPCYCLISAPTATATAVTASLYRQFSDPANLDYIEIIEADILLHLLAPVKVGTNFSLTSGKSMHKTYLADLNVAAAAGANVDGTGVKIAVLDTGIESGKTVSGYHDLLVTGGANPTQLDNNGHGTAMTEIIKAVAPQAEVHVIRVSDSGQVYVWDLMAGITTAVYSVDAHILNMSFGCQCLNQPCPYCGGGTNRSTVCEKFLDQMNQLAINGIGPDPILVAAAGNDGATVGFDWPAHYKYVLAIGSVKHNKDRSRFSNIGTQKPIDLYGMCPGGDTDPNDVATEWVGEGSDGGIPTYCVGTSPATAYASGVLALWRHHREKNKKQISSGVLLGAVQNRSKQDVGGYNSNDHGMGRLIYDP
jgi:subtilisin family serine protease